MMLSGVWHKMEKKTNTPLDPFHMTYDSISPGRKTYVVCGNSPLFQGKSHIPFLGRKYVLISHRTAPGTYTRIKDTGTVLYVQPKINENQKSGSLSE